MIWNIFQRADPPAPRVEGPLAVATLLVRVARSDGVYDPEETALIHRLLIQRYGTDDAARLLARAEAAEEMVGDTVHLTRAIKDEILLEDRDAYLMDLWRVVLSDGQRDPHEDGLMRLVSNLLGLSDRDSALARQAVQGGGG